MNRHRSGSRQSTPTPPCIRDVSLGNQAGITPTVGGGGGNDDALQQKRMKKEADDGKVLFQRALPHNTPKQRVAGLPPLSNRVVSLNSTPIDLSEMGQDSSISQIEIIDVDAFGDDDEENENQGATKGSPLGFKKLRQADDNTNSAPVPMKPRSVSKKRVSVGNARGSGGRSPTALGSRIPAGRSKTHNGDSRRAATPENDGSDAAVEGPPATVVEVETVQTPPPVQPATTSTVKPVVVPPVQVATPGGTPRGTQQYTTLHGSARRDAGPQSFVASLVSPAPSKQHFAVPSPSVQAQTVAAASVLPPYQRPVNPAPPPTPLWRSEMPLDYVLACGWYKGVVTDIITKKPKMKMLKADHRPHKADKVVSFDALDVSVRSFYFSAAAVATLTPEECHRRLCDIMLWKLSRGQFRPGLMQKCVSNPPQVVKKIILESLAQLNQAFMRHGLNIATNSDVATAAARRSGSLAAASQVQFAAEDAVVGSKRARSKTPERQATLTGNQSATPSKTPLRQTPPPASPLQQMLVRTGGGGGDSAVKPSPLRGILGGSTTAEAAVKSSLELLGGNSSLVTIDEQQQQQYAEAAKAARRESVQQRTIAVCAAVKNLSQLKGIGPATATAILQQFQLANGERGICPFFADESAQMVLSARRNVKAVKLQYSEKEVRDFTHCVLMKHLTLREKASHPHEPVPTPAEISHAMWAQTSRLGSGK